uniref:KH_10 domain-containing protein n=1 Tax=Angiostrongylus cantonensis TaxID=6313 RepID=A0A0K0DGX4_ANGCA
MSIDDNRRKRLINELKRRTDIEHYRGRSIKPAGLHQKFCPVVLMFAVSEKLRDDVAIVGLNQWLEKRTQDGSFNFPNILIQALPHSMSESFKVSFSTHMEVPAAQRSHLVGTPDGAQLLVISRFTKALLHFPSQSEELPQTLFFFFTGQPEAILKARRFVQGLLPMQLCFHAGNEDLRAKIEDKVNRIVKFYDELLRVSVSVVPSDLESVTVLPGDQTRHYISLRTSEYNVGALYAVMRRVLKHGDDIPMVTPTDYAEMLPLVPDLIKHACEVNFRCRLEPCSLVLPPLPSILTPTVTSLSHSLEGNIPNHADASVQLVGSVESPIVLHENFSSASSSRRKCMETSIDTKSSACQNTPENGASFRPVGAANRSRHSSPQNYSYEKYNSRYINKEHTTQGKDLLQLARPRNNYGERRVRQKDDTIIYVSILTLVIAGLRPLFQGNSSRSNRSGPNPYSKHHLALRCRSEVQNQRPRNPKVELQRRVRNGQFVEGQQEFCRRPSRRMDVMDLIKLASAEDSDRRRGSIEDNSCIVDSGDTHGGNTIVE